MLGVVTFFMKEKQKNKQLIQPFLQQRFEEFFAALGDEKMPSLYTTVMRQCEIPLIRAALKHCNDNKSKTACLLSVSRVTLRNKMHKYSIESSANSS